ncbi:MAG: glycoside hydrolase family 75 protein [Verrucomicrobiota bacterium]
MSVNPGTGSSDRGDRSGRASGRVFLFVVLLGLMLVPVVAYFSGAGGKIKRGVIDVIEAAKEKPEPVKEIVVKEVEVEKIVEVEVEAPPEPLPSRHVGRQTIDTASLWNGLQVRSESNVEEGARATTERADPTAYELLVQLRLRAPRPAQTRADFEALNPSLLNVLPDFPKLLEAGRVSGFFYKLYENKADRVQTYLTRLDRILTRDNFYDCESIYELEHPDTGQRALLIQSEMDVVSDGTDGDRRPELDEYIANSANFQPWTSYGWAKRTKQPNPLLPRYEEKLREYEEEYKIRGLSADRNQYLRDSIARLKREVADLKGRSFLIAETDPFIVVPLYMLRYRDVDPFAPTVGDYAVVIHGDKVYPAIVGDAGPTFQAGEASLRMAKQLNENAGVYSRPVSDLTVSYLVFPGSAEETKGPPNLDIWYERCSELLDGLGGLGPDVSLHRWKDAFDVEAAVPAEAPSDPPSETGAEDGEEMESGA